MVNVVEYKVIYVWIQSCKSELNDKSRAKNQL